MGITFSSPALLWFLLSLVPLAFLYIYLVRRQSRAVPSLNIWESAVSSSDHLLSTPLKRFFEWMAAALFICSSVFTAAGIHVRNASEAKHLIFLLDNSSSMTRPVESGSVETLLEQSTSGLQQILQSVSSSTNWTVVRLSPVPRVLNSGQGPPEPPDLNVPSAPFLASVSRLKRFLLSLTSTPSTTGSEQLYFFSDRQIPDFSVLPASFEHFTFVPMGGPDENVAITDGRMRRIRDDSDRLVITLRNFSSREQTFPMRLHGFRKENLQVSLAAGEEKKKHLTVPSSTDDRNRMGLFLNANDSFPRDNGAYFLKSSPQTIPVQIQLPQDSSTFLRSVIQAIGPPFVPTRKEKPGNRDQVSDSAWRRSIRVRNETPGEPQDRQPGGEIIFHPPAAQENTRSAEAETRFSRATSTPLTDGLSFKELKIKRYTPMNPDPDEQCVITSGEECVAVQGNSGQGDPYVRFGFSLPDSNLAALPEFPLLLKRILTSFKKQRSKQKRNTKQNDPKSDRRREWIRTRLRPDGSIESTSISRSPHSHFSIQPGWYQQQTENTKPRQTTVNFFYPSESNLSRSTSNRNLPSTNVSDIRNGSSTDSFPLRYVFLLFAGFFWVIFLFLTSR